MGVSVSYRGLYITDRLQGGGMPFNDRLVGSPYKYTLNKLNIQYTLIIKYGVNWLSFEYSFSRAASISAICLSFILSFVTHKQAK